MSLQRLDKLISSQLNISRSNTRTSIRKGFAKVDGQVVKDPAFSVDPLVSQVIFDGQVVEYKKHIYIVMNKPKGVLSATEDKTKPTVIDLVPEKLKRNGLFPAGRLDKDTTGLIIITDDGDFAHKIMSPNKNVYKTYIALLDGPVSKEIENQFSSGITLADGTVCRNAYLKSLGNNYAEIRICEGKYHQIKRMFGVVGLGVNQLKRTAIGKYSLPEDLAEGNCIEVEKSQLEPLFVNI